MSNARDVRGAVKRHEKAASRVERDSGMTAMAPRYGGLFFFLESTTMNSNDMDDDDLQETAGTVQPRKHAGENAAVVRLCTANEWNVRAKTDRDHTLIRRG